MLNGQRGYLRPAPPPRVEPPPARKLPDLAINAALGRETCVKMILDAVAAKEKTMAE